MKKALSAILAVILLLSLCACGSNNGDDTGEDTVISGTLDPIYYYDDEIVYSGYTNEESSYPGDIDRADFTPICRFLAVSNITGEGAFDAEKAGKLITATNNYYASTDLKWPFDGFFFCGGITGDGSDATLSAVSEYINYTVDESTVQYVALSASEAGVLAPKWSDYFEFQLDRHVTINLINAITISPDASGSYAEKAETFTNDLKASEKSNRELPVFVISGAEENEELDALLKDHPQVVLVSPENKTGDDMIKRDGITHIYVGDTSAYHVIELDELGRMLVRNIDENGNVLKNDDGTDAEWFIQTPWKAE